MGTFLLWTEGDIFIVERHVGRGEPVPLVVIGVIVDAVGEQLIAIAVNWPASSKA
jgi:hypothetical protein